MGTGHFCRPLHVAMQVGLSLIQTRIGFWRTVSEDSRYKPYRIFPADYLHPSHCYAELLPRSAGFTDVPAYGQILLRLAIPNLRTVIVTAAVYWGFPSK